MNQGFRVIFFILAMAFLTAANVANLLLGLDSALGFALVGLMCIACLAIGKEF